MPDSNDGKNMNGNINNPDPNYWRSFEELYQEKKYLDEVNNEFKDGASDSPEISNMSGLSRRKFLALLGASAALAGTACTNYHDKGEIIPYNKKPEEITLGAANYYASTCSECSTACGILIKTREGRPIKVDGNPDHPVSKGKICAQGQASIMNLYDPDRLQKPLMINRNRFDEVSWYDADAEIIGHLMYNVGDKEIAVITRTIFSPTENKLLNDFTKKFPTAKFYSYEQFNENIRNSAWRKCYGSGSFPVVKWNEADVIVSLDADFLGTAPDKVENARLFSEGRDVMNKRFNRLYVVESNLSITGMNADYRLRLRPEAQYSLIMALLNELNKRGAINLPLNISKYSLDKLSVEYNLSKKDLNYLVDDLIKNKGKAIIYAGDHLPEEVHIAVNVLNEYLGNKNLYDSESSKITLRPLASYEELRTLISRMKAGQVGAVIHYDSNPVYNLPSDLGYADALANVEMVVSLTQLHNESTAYSNYVLPIHHGLEAWGDAKTRTGIYSLQQPVIAPLYNTRQREAILQTWISGDPKSYTDDIYHKYLMENWKNNIYPTLNRKLAFKDFWYGALHDGVVINKNERSHINLEFKNSVISNLPTTNNQLSGFALHIKESYSLRDGRFSNNGWLQELPHPVSKVTWDNYASISPASASSLGLKTNDLVEINVGGNSLTLPVLVQPGAADNSITIETGYGRTNSGTVAESVGFNVNELFNITAGVTPWLYSDVEIKKVPGSYKLVLAQTYYDFTEELKKDLPEKRGIIMEGTVDEYLKHPDFIAKETAEYRNLPSVNPPIPYEGLKWGMAIDLNKCLGCSDCVVACMSENNIPVVGKDQVDVGREMHWLRIDRYYSESPEDPKIINQPMLCQQCDQAPCENVCPVVATTHSPDGLNQMIYNRCVGTRYCSNNCPYKVRRFNFFNFRDHFRDGYQESPVFALLQNPEVTVRSRGVMEKCTFCIQRIAEAKAEAKREGRQVDGSGVTTACQDACGTNAIKFGNIFNEKEEFYKYRNHELGFYVLDHLNVIPNVTYIAKLRNTHSEEA